jgi:hypothetical protein
MSAIGTKRTCQSLSAMSAFGGKADIVYTPVKSAIGPDGRGSSNAGEVLDILGTP